MRAKINKMFSFFQKNVFLADLIEGITDFHNHILPGIDDGANTVEDSVELIKGFKTIGINKFVATPHVIGEYYSNTPETINKAYLKLKKSLDSSIQMNFSAEYMMDQHFVEIIENEQILPVCNRNVLVEMSYFQPPLNLNEILFKLQSNSFSPILAHPERYGYLHHNTTDKYIDLKSRGCRFQLNMLSLSDHYGRGIQKMAYKLLDDHLIDFIASDVHRIDHIEKIKKIKIKKKYLNSLEQITRNSKNLFS